MPPLDLDEYRLADPSLVDSPALLFYPALIQENIRRTLARVPFPERLRPHIKTHKCAEILRLQLDAGIRKFKCATIAELELAAVSGAPDLLLAYQPVGPRADRFIRIVEKYGASIRFSCIVDNEATARELSTRAAAADLRLRVLLDVDCGQGRTGVPAGEPALALYARLAAIPHLEVRGLHIYDGHIHDHDVEVRRLHCEQAWDSVRLPEFAARGLPVQVIVAGGTPTFPFHAARPGVECSPGTNILWDAGYAEHFPDLDFRIAALLLTRVLSKPAANRLCFDLGHKAVASEGPHPRVLLPALQEPRVIMHNEEHLVIEARNAASFSVGDVLYAFPWHICPTVALYGEASVVRGGRVTERWKIAARDRRISV